MVRKSAKSKADVKQVISSEHEMERFNRIVGKIMEEKHFASLEEANQFLKEWINGRTMDEIMAEYGEDPVQQAQDLAFQAMNAGNAKEARKLAERALALDPHCIDAKMVLAFMESDTQSEAIDRLRAIAADAERTMGEEFIQQAKGHFWLVNETRPYMRLRYEIMRFLISEVRIPEAIHEGEAMLELNPGDNQGIRYILIGLYLYEEDLEAARRLLEQYADDAMAFFAWGRVLERFLARDEAGAKAAFEAAYQNNPHFYDLITARKPIPTQHFDTYTPGDISEAMVALGEQGLAWLKHPVAIAWLDSLMPKPKSKAKGAQKAQASKAKGRGAKRGGKQTGASSAGAMQFYIFKVMLADEHSIWRRIAIRSDQTLDDLHKAIYKAFDREEEHLYSFYIAPPGTKGGWRKRIQAAMEYTHPFNLEDGGPPFEDEDELADASQTTIVELGLEKGQLVDYLFDFGDEWWHELKVEKIETIESDFPPVSIIERRGDSPPQYGDYDEDEDDEDAIDEADDDESKK